MAARVIPCLDVKDGKVVKGKGFIQLKDAGDPVELAGFYSREGADELTFLDISATAEGRKTVLDLVRRTSREVGIPFAVGGGIGEMADMEALFKAGADKVSVNTAAVERPSLIAGASAAFGREKIVAALDARWNEQMQDWEIYTHGGKRPTGKSAVAWAREVEELGAGEILLTSIDRDGGNDGYDLELTKAVSSAVSIPVIASGGAGKPEHFSEVIMQAGADAVLAASVFHYGALSVREVKEHLRECGIEVNLNGR